MSALMADHRDYADDERQPSLFDVLAPPSPRSHPGEAQEPEGGRVVEFPRRPDVREPDPHPKSAATDTSPEDAVAASPAGTRTQAPVQGNSTLAQSAAGGQSGLLPFAGDAHPGDSARVALEPTSYVEPAPAVAPEDAWLTEIAPDLDEAELAALAPHAVPGRIDLAPEVGLAGEVGTQRAAGSPLAGPTLDDVVSRVWEGLVMGLPAACPACHGEVLPAAPGVNGGSCTSCGTAIE
jgi:hypothetical protein